MRLTNSDGTASNVEEWRYPISREKWSFIVLLSIFFAVLSFFLSPVLARVRFNRFFKDGRYLDEYDEFIKNPDEATNWRYEKTKTAIAYDRSIHGFQEYKAERLRFESSEWIWVVWFFLLVFVWLAA